MPTRSAGTHHAEAEHVKMATAGRVRPTGDSGPARTVGDASLYRKYEASSVDDKQVAHGPETLLHATVLRGPMITVIGTVNVGEGEVPSFRNSSSTTLSNASSNAPTPRWRDYRSRPPTVRRNSPRPRRFPSDGSLGGQLAERWPPRPPSPDRPHGRSQFQRRAHSGHPTGTPEERNAQRHNRPAQTAIGAVRRRD
jgi:hypothetical protein